MKVQPETPNIPLDWHNKLYNAIVTPILGTFSIYDVFNFHGTYEIIQGHFEPVINIASQICYAKCMYSQYSNTKM